MTSILLLRPKTHPDKSAGSNSLEVSVDDAGADLPTNPQVTTVPEQPTLCPDEPKFTLFPKLPAELRIKVWSLVPRPPRVISIKKNPLHIRTNKPIPTRVTCSESRDIISQNLVFFKGVCIDLEKDTFLLPDCKTAYFTIRHWPDLAHQIRSLALEPFGFFERKFARYKILELARIMGNLEELMLCLNRKEELQQSSGQLREFLELEQVTDEGGDETDDQRHPWKVPEISTIVARETTALPSFEGEVMEWLEKIKR
jgi:hypothetical protein